MNMLPRINPLLTLFNTAQQQEEIKCSISKENLSLAEVSQWNQPQAQYHPNTGGVFALKLLVQPPWHQVVTNVCVKPLLHSLSLQGQRKLMNFSCGCAYSPPVSTCLQRQPKSTASQAAPGQPAISPCVCILTVWQAGFTPWAAAEARLPDGIAYRCFRERKMTSLINE